MAYFIPHPVVLTPVTPYEQARALFNQRQAQVNQLKIQLDHLQAQAALGLPVNAELLKLVMAQLEQARQQRNLAKVHKDSLDPRLKTSKVASTSGKTKSGSSGKRSSGKAKSSPSKTSGKRSSSKAKISSSDKRSSGYRTAAAATSARASSSVLPGARATSSVLPGARATSSVPFTGGTAFVPGGVGFYYC